MLDEQREEGGVVGVGEGRRECGVEADDDVGGARKALCRHIHGGDSYTGINIA